jgi:hypothetical protein
MPWSVLLPFAVAAAVAIDQHALKRVSRPLRLRVKKNVGGVKKNVGGVSCFCEST